MAGAATVADQGYVGLDRVGARAQAEHLVVALVERGALAEEAEAGADAVDVGVDRDVVAAVGEEQDAGGAGAVASSRRGAAWPKPMATTPLI